MEYGLIDSAQSVVLVSRLINRAYQHERFQITQAIAPVISTSHPRQLMHPNPSPRLIRPALHRNLSFLLTSTDLLQSPMH